MIKRSFECKRDNLLICGYEYRRKEGRLPAVILSHGFMANQSMCRNYAKLMAKTLMPWICSCGEMSNGRFCPNCGKKRLE